MQSFSTLMGFYSYLISDKITTALISFIYFQTCVLHKNEIIDLNSILSLGNASLFKTEQFHSAYYGNVGRKYSFKVTQFIFWIGIGGFMVRQRSRTGQGKNRRSVIRKDSSGSISEQLPGRDDGMVLSLFHQALCLDLLWKRTVLNSGTVTT